MFLKNEGRFLVALLQLEIDVTSPPGVWTLEYDFADGKMD